MGRLELLLAIIVLVALPDHNALAQATSGSASAPATSAASQQASGLSQDIDKLKLVVADQQRQIDRQHGMIEAASQRRDGGYTAIYTAIGVVFAAFVGGFFALRNQNLQAEQGRLLKAVELIMESRSGYQADMRAKNLSVFLDAATTEHLKNIKDTFSGPEFTDLHVQLAEAMSAQAKTPEEALSIWKAILREKKVFNRVTYSGTDKPSAT